ncbi:hypothetical protein J5N97_006626 [Dioscorea zingiberensis]|uniref:DYW domain-containing protein n=1 Tax=Dioscorea zingiberensis TaxID=325984 RepID=A0A9D5DCI0_9LILI|nr:hypothetical protein J5N97_006626 [Dioscorea zingiberensis]
MSTTLAFAPLLTTPATIKIPNQPNQQQHHHHHPNLSLLRLCAHVREAHQVHAIIIKSAQSSDPYYAGRLAEFYAILSTEPCLSHAGKVLSSFPNPPTFIYNTLIRAHLNAGDPLHSLLLYHQMLSHSTDPDRFSFTFVLKACTQLRALPLGQQLHSQIFKLGLVTDAHIRNKLIHLYATLGDLVNARKLFDGSPEPDIIAWNSLLEGYAAAKDGESIHEVFDMMPARDVVSWNTLMGFYIETGEFEEAILTFRSMQESGECQPNRVTMISVLTAVTHSSALGQGKWVHAYIDRNKIELDEKLGSALINMYSKCGCVEGAVYVFDMTRKNCDTWNAMICGFTANGHSLRALELFSKMEKTSGVVPNYITFSCVLNACSHGGLVDEGMRLFEKMSAVYAGDSSLSRKTEIYEMLGEMGDRLSLVGYEPDKEQVLLDIEDDEAKESSLSLHSEKLAIAFSLISTEACSTIRIVKNLRVCGDCHAAIKLLTVIYDRDIIVRDSSRFHHFQKGSCSCGDYW